MTTILIQLMKSDEEEEMTLNDEAFVAELWRSC